MGLEEAKELFAYAYCHKLCRPIVRNLIKHYYHGQFDDKKALKQCAHIADIAVKAYVIEHCSSSSNYFDIFDAETCRITASKLCEYFLPLIKNRELTLDNINELLD